mgnify:CR=1 FL=1
MTAVIKKTVNLLALHGTEFSLEGNSADASPVEVTESPSTFIQKSMSGELSCVGIGPRWRTDLDSVTSLLSSIPPGAVALIPEADAEVAHLLGLAGFGKVIEFWVGHQWRLETLPNHVTKLIRTCGPPSLVH